MKNEKKVEGLRANAQRKRQLAIEKTEQGIRTLLKDKRPINFKTVAEVSGVSTAWLYKEPEIKARIEQLREQGSQIELVPVRQKASDASRDAIIKTLKERVKNLVAENRGLRDHVEVVQGIAMQITDLNKQIEKLTVENSKLKEQQDLCLASTDVEQTTRQNSLASAALCSRTVTSLSKKKAASSSTSNLVQSELDKLGIKMNSTLEKKIKSAPEDVVFTAIGSLKQAQSEGQIRNPSGFLVSAIEGQWTPNKLKSLKPKFPSGFLEAYQRLCEAGVVDGEEPSNLPIWNNEIYVRVINLNAKPWEPPYIQMRWGEALVHAGLG